MNKIYLLTMFFCTAVYGASDLQFSSSDFNDFVDVLEDAEALLVRKDVDTVTRLCHMVRGIGKITQDIVCKVDLASIDKKEILGNLEKFKVKIYKIKEEDCKDNSEQQKMSAGLTTIIYNVVSIMVNPAKLGTYLLNIMSGLGKIVSAVLADGKINRDDWKRLMKAFACLFSIKNLIGLMGAGKSVKRRALPAVY